MFRLYGDWSTTVDTFTTAKQSLCKLELDSSPRDDGKAGQGMRTLETGLAGCLKKGLWIGMDSTDVLVQGTPPKTLKAHTPTSVSQAGVKPNNPGIPAIPGFGLEIDPLRTDHCGARRPVQCHGRSSSGVKCFHVLSPSAWGPGQQITWEQLHSSCTHPKLEYINICSNICYIWSNVQTPFTYSTSQNLSAQNSPFRLNLYGDTWSTKHARRLCESSLCLSLGFNMDQSLRNVFLCPCPLRFGILRHQRASADGSFCFVDVWS